MSLSKDEVRHVALLARLELSPDEEEKFSRQLGQILDYMERLKTLDVTGVEPMAHAVRLRGPERPDEVRESLPREEVLGGAPARVAGGVAVPKIIE